ncbi:hypothetical protein GOP47_0015548 [Adiantum capillus-veneris]|uniref:Uncharacterized protein n=1 Tax=Adiantum capillus-veneris TaxID=13818 RepID=A0A9D4ZCR0_ADICA|nr:hypothetical protein GOP47_0015548 [Adiantum capillus-veneris]
MDEQLKDDERFDASQYAFFGGAISQEVELGGLDEEEEIASSGTKYEEDERSLNPSSDKEEVDVLDTGPQLDGPYDISNISGSLRSLGLGTLSDTEVDQHNTSHVPSYLSERQWEVQGGGFSQMPFPGVRPHPRAALQAAMFHNGQQPVAASQANLFPGYRLPHVPLPIRGPLQPYPYREASHAFFPPPPPWHLMPPNVQQGISQGFVPGYSQHHMAQQYAAMPVVPEALLQRQFGHPRVPLVHAQQGLLNPILSAHPFLASEFLDERDNARDLRYEFEQRERHTVRQQGRHGSPNYFRNSSQQQFRSKYMSSEEIESIAKIQRAATQSSDPYVGDYYHQAVQAKTGAGTVNGKHHFAPNQLRDLSFQRRASVLQPTFVPVDGLGKVPFSSVRSPRPLLEVDDFVSQTGCTSLKRSECPLEQEPMLAARIAIEDGLCRLLDVDDIDRFLRATQPPDGGAELQRQRQLLLEELAVSLQLLEPSNTKGESGTGSTENNAHLAETDTKDLVFLHIVSLPKGRKLLSRYLELFPEGAVVSSPEQPVFRPFSSGSGEGVSLIMKSLLDRATNLLTDTAIAMPLEDRKCWQATFDSFFTVLFKYCTNTFDRILHTTAMSSSSSERPLNISEAAAEKISKELPIELLRATLPHMNEQQRKVLLEFTQRSIVKGAAAGHKDNAHCNSVDEDIS